MSKTRIYAVSEAGSEAPARLVEAGSKSKAIAHVVGTRFTASIPKTKELVAAMQAGAQVEAAAADDAGEGDNGTGE